MKFKSFLYTFLIVAVTSLGCKSKRVSETPIPPGTTIPATGADKPNADYKPAFVGQTCTILRQANGLRDHLRLLVMNSLESSKSLGRALKDLGWVIKSLRIPAFGVGSVRPVKTVNSSFVASWVSLARLVMVALRRKLPYPQNYCTEFR